MSKGSGFVKFPATETLEWVTDANSNSAPSLTVSCISFHTNLMCKFANQQAGDHVGLNSNALRMYLHSIYYLFFTVWKELGGNRVLAVREII